MIYLMLPGGTAHNLHDLTHLYRGLDLYYAGAAQPLTTAGEELDDLHHDLSDLFVLDHLDHDLSVRGVKHFHLTPYCSLTEGCIHLGLRWTH